ncbi:MAG: hypothetical protein HY296_04625 [Thaumarchaeota archaeon]|nr:hypothetical protein [Nitrososphaerota archaeon]
MNEPQKELLDVLVARESVPIDELREQIESVRELIRLGCAILEVKLYPWDVEFEVRPTTVGMETLTSLVVNSTGSTSPSESRTALLTNAY